jgi:hypothetical protein
MACLSIKTISKPGIPESFSFHLCTPSGREREDSRQVFLEGLDVDGRIYSILPGTKAEYVLVGPGADCF